MNPPKIRRVLTGVSPSGVSPFVRIRLQGSSVSSVNTRSLQHDFITRPSAGPPLSGLPGVLASPLPPLFSPLRSRLPGVLPPPCPRFSVPGFSASAVAKRGVPHTAGTRRSPYGSGTPHSPAHRRGSASSCHRHRSKKSPSLEDAWIYLRRAHLRNAAGKETMLPGAIQ